MKKMVTSELSSTKPAVSPNQIGSGHVYSNEFPAVNDAGNTIQHINNLSHRYGITKFSEEQLSEIKHLLIGFPIHLDQIKHILKVKPDSIGTLLHFSQLLSPPAIIWLLSHAELSTVNYQDQLGRTPLHEAIRYNNLWLVESLLAHSASPLIADRQGLTAISEAAFLGRETVLERLLLTPELSTTPKITTPASPTRKSNNIPISVASKNGHLSCLKLLINHKVGQINGYSAKGNTPLIIAILAGHLDVVEWLLKQGASPDLANFDGVSAREIADKHATDSALVELLYEY